MSPDYSHAFNYYLFVYNSQIYASSLELSLELQHHIPKGLINISPGISSGNFKITVFKIKFLFFSHLTVYSPPRLSK